MRAIAFIIGMLVTMTVANAQNASGSPDQGAIEGWPPVPPLQDQAVIGNYCIHRNLLYSLGDILCLGDSDLSAPPRQEPPPADVLIGRRTRSTAVTSIGRRQHTAANNCAQRCVFYSGFR